MEGARNPNVEETRDQGAKEDREETRDAGPVKGNVNSETETETVVKWSKRLRKRDLLKKPDRLGC